MACSSSCPNPGSHATYGECMRSKNIRAGQIDQTQQKKADRNLAAYANARKYGIQPKTTYPRDVQHAIQQSEKTGTAYQA